MYEAIKYTMTVIGCIGYMMIIIKVIKSFPVGKHPDYYDQLRTKEKKK